MAIIVEVHTLVKNMYATLSVMDVASYVVDCYLWMYCEYAYV
jgi:hypothetical protein